jgi:hypothetical protein
MTLEGAQQTAARRVPELDRSVICYEIVAEFVEIDPTCSRLNIDSSISHLPKGVCA